MTLPDKLKTPRLSGTPRPDKRRNWKGGFKEETRSVRSWREAGPSKRSQRSDRGNGRATYLKRANSQCGFLSCSLYAGAKGKDPLGPRREMWLGKGKRGVDGTAGFRIKGTETSRQ